MADLVSRGISKRNQDKIDDISISVRNFGAKGDGVTDDTLAFKNCNSYCALNNKVMYVPNGDYRISETLVFSCSVEGQSKGGVNLNFYHAANTSSFRVFGDGRPPKWSESTTSTRALIKDQASNLNYVTTNNPGDALLFNKGDYIHVVGGKNPYDADDSLWRYDAIWRVESVDGTTGKITVNGTIDVSLNDDGFNPTSAYVNCLDWKQNTSYNEGDTVYSDTGTYKGIFICRSSGVSNSTGDIGSDTAAENPKWKRVSYSLGALRGNSVMLDSRPLIHKIDSPLVNKTYSNFTINYKGSGNALNALSTKAIAFCEFSNINVNGNYAIGCGSIEGCNYLYFNNITKIGRGVVGTIAYRSYASYNVRNIFIDNLISDSGTDKNDENGLLFLESFSQVYLSNSKLSKGYEFNGRGIYLLGGSEISVTDCELKNFYYPIRSDNGSVCIGETSTHHDGRVVKCYGNKITISSKAFRSWGYATSFESFLGNHYNIFGNDSDHPSVIDFKPDRLEAIDVSFSAKANDTNRHEALTDGITKNKNLVVLAADVYYESAPVGSQVTVQFYKKNGNKSARLFASTSSKNSGIVGDVSPYSQIQEGDGSTSRVLLASAKDELDLLISSNALATSGNIKVRFYCLVETNSRKVNFSDRGYI